ncbi:MAG: hypothetical protein GY842_29185 [bacterium]|nr:hypothetical protein [bacterium]
MTDPCWRIRRIVSGGQTGVDRAALDVARELDIPHGGYVPKGRRAEDGPIHPRYQLTEMHTANYEARTLANVCHSDATLLISRGPLTGGSAFTKRAANQHNRPVLHVDLALEDQAHARVRIREWLTKYQPEVLNIAGPRQSTSPGIYEETCALLRVLWTDLPHTGRHAKPEGQT